MGPTTVRVGLALSFLALAAYSIRFNSRQNKGLRAGGPISPPKMLWLSYTLAAWFILPCFLWLDASLDPAVRLLFGWFLLSFLLRGVAELVLIYRVMHWTPIYGISHDLFCIGLVWFLRRDLVVGDVPSARALAFSSSLIVGLIAEITFAGMFLQTKSASRGIYFASTERHWRFINGTTTMVLAFVLPDFLATLIGLYGPELRLPAFFHPVRIIAGSAVAALALLALAVWTSRMRRPGALDPFLK